MQERRKYVRADGLVLVNYRFPQLNLEGKSSAYDISGAGVRITADKLLEIGSLVELEIYLPGSSQPILAKGEVIWAQKCKETPGTKIATKKEKAEYFYTGIKFSVIEDNNKTRILTYVHRKLIQYKQEGRGRHSQI